MNKDAFTYLYLHALGLAELGRARFADLAAADDAAPVSLAPADDLSDPLPPAQDDGDDLDLYLARLYGGRDALASRIAQVHARAHDVEQLAERLPTGLPSLLAPLDGRGLAAWLDMYAQGDENLHDIVQRIRCADVGSPA